MINAARLQQRLLLPGSALRLKQSSLTQNIAFCSVLSAGIRGNDLAKGLTALAGAGAKPSSSPFGQGILFTATDADKLNYGSVNPITTSDGAGTGAFTMLAIANPASSGSQFPVLAGLSMAPSPFAAAFLIGNDDLDYTASAGAISFNCGGASNGGANATGVLDGLFHVFMGRRSSALAAGHSIWVDGKNVTLTTRASDGISGTGSGFSIGGEFAFGDNVNAAACTIVLVACWNRALLDKEIVDVSLNPMLLFESGARSWTVVAAAAGTTVNVTGAGATAAAGTFGKAAALAIAGVGATVAAGSFSEAESVTLTGAGVTGSAGSLGIQESKAPGGAGATVAAGAFAETVTVGLPGASMTAAAAAPNETAVTLPSVGTSITAAAGTVTAGTGTFVAMSGAGVSSAAGSLAKTVTFALPGAGITASPGALAWRVSVSLASAPASLAAGAFSVSAGNNTSAALPGVGITMSAGPFAISASFGMAGAQASAAAGSLGVKDTAGLASAAANAAAGDFLSAIFIPGNVPIVTLPSVPRTQFPARPRLRAHPANPRPQ